MRTTRWWANHKESRLNEFFTPFATENLAEHQLPERGFLFYQYDDNKQLKAIYWQAANAAKEDKWKLVYERLSNQERRYGNNFKAIARQNPSFIKNSIKLQLLKEDEASPIWQEIRYYHDDGLLAAEHHLSTTLDINKFRQYEFNPNGQLIRVDTDQHDRQSTATDLYAWQLGGASFARQHKSKTIKEDHIE